MDFSRSSLAEDEKERDLAGGGIVETGECKWQGEGAGEGPWPFIHAGVGPRWTSRTAEVEREPNGDWSWEAVEEHLLVPLLAFDASKWLGVVGVRGEQGEVSSARQVLD